MPEQSVLNLDEVRVRVVERNEEPLHRQLMATHHYLGYLPKIGQTLWYVATYHEQWVALLSFSAAAWKCAVRDRWIGWDFHRQYDYDRLKLIANNSRFVILPHGHRPNLGSKILSLCHRRLSAALGDLRRPATFPRHRLSCGQLVVSGAYPRLSAHPPRLQRHRVLAQKSVRQTLATQRPNSAIQARAAISLSSRSTQNEVERPTDAIVAELLYRHSRSAPPPGTTPLSADGVGHRLWGDPVWDARLQGDCGLGAKSRPQGQRKVWLPSG
jgi:Druantia protein DruA